MDKITVSGKTYFSIILATKEYGCTRKTIYDWIQKGILEVKNIAHVKFVRKVD